MIPLFVLDTLDKLQIRVVPYHLVLEGPTEKPRPPEKIETESYVFRFLDKEDMSELNGIPERMLSEQNLVQRLDEGAMCYGAIAGNHIIAFTWCNLRYCTIASHRLFTLESNEAYLFDAFTVPNYRGRGIAPYLRYLLFRELEKQDRTTMYSITMSANAPAMTFKRKLGVGKMETGIYIRLFNRWHFHTLLRKYRKRPGHEFRNAH